FHIWSRASTGTRSLPRLYKTVLTLRTLYTATPTFRFRIAVDRCSSINPSRGEPMRKLTLLIILVATAAVALPQQMQMPMPKTSGPQSDAQKAFEKLKTLAGSWEGTYTGMSAKVSLRDTSNGNEIIYAM